MGLPVITPAERFQYYAQSTARVGSPDRVDGSASLTGVCGDSIQVGIKVEGDRIVDIGYMPQGCGHTWASAGAMAELAHGRTLEQALELGPEDVDAELGGLPEDHQHCARLAINTLGEAIADYLARKIKSDRAE
jgi:nitrogen fixation NifU-like protein